MITLATGLFALNLALVEERAPTADTQPTPTPARERPLSLDSATLTGDWNGLRPALADRGVTLNLYVNHQLQSISRDGLQSRGGVRSSASLDAILTVDLKKLLGISDTDALLHLQSNWGAGVNPRMGAIYEINDDADGDLGLHVAQLWFRRHILDRKISLTVGFLDFQTIVDRNEFANSEDRQFWNQTLDNNPLVPLRIGLGAALTIKPRKGWTIIAGVADAQSVLYKPGFSTTFHDESWFVGYLEQTLSFDIPSRSGPLPGAYRVGLVYDPTPRDEFSNRGSQYFRDRDRSLVGYLNFDQLVYREIGTVDQGLGLFWRYGYRDGSTQRLDRFHSFGIQYKGAIPERDNDVLGLGMSLVRTGKSYRDHVDDASDNETAYELYYAIALSKWLVVTPDLQYIDNPGATGDRPASGLAGGIRIRVSF